MSNPDTPPQGSSTPLQHRFDTLAKALVVAILNADADGLVTYVNPAARELFWRAEDQLMGEGWLGCVHIDDRADVAATAMAVCKTGNADRADFRIDVAGYTRWVRARFNPLPDDPDAEASGHGWVAIFDDVTVDRATSDELARQAAHDPLTGLPNRTLLRDRLEQAIARCRRAEVPLAVFFLDLDKFKPVNDQLGHKAGDDVLREVGHRIRVTMRTEDTAARLGGDEFVVVTEGTDREITEEVAARLADAIEQPMEIEGESLSMAASIGIVWTPVPWVGGSVLLDLADQAMYQAKRAAKPYAFAPDPPQPLPGTPT
jgi:diguanylate cyclase (GGDEF)-like protein/PAS domain S-box-containing protein